MPVIVVTRLRLRDPALLDEFFTDAVAAIEQAMKPEGNLGADALADANNAWWSVTAWQERGLMRAFVDSEPHLGISARGATVPAVLAEVRELAAVRHPAQECPARPGSRPVQGQGPRPRSSRLRRAAGPDLPQMVW